MRRGARAQSALIEIGGDFGQEAWQGKRDYLCPQGSAALANYLALRDLASGEIRRLIGAEFGQRFCGGGGVHKKPEVARSKHHLRQPTSLVPHREGDEPLGRRVGGDSASSNSFERCVVCPKASPIRPRECLMVSAEATNVAVPCSPELHTFHHPNETVSVHVPANP
jgi:hypothetical protein